MVTNKNKSSKPVIEIKEMHKWFGNFHVLKNISLGVNQGERIVICGPSGSGKSTLIRCINRCRSNTECSRSCFNSNVTSICVFNC